MHGTRSNQATSHIILTVRWETCEPKASQHLKHSQKHIPRKAICNELTMPLSTAASAQAFNPPKCSKGLRDLELRARYLENNEPCQRLLGGGHDEDNCTWDIQMHLCSLEMGHCTPTCGTVYTPPLSVVKMEMSLMSQSCWVLLGSGYGRRLVCWSSSQHSSVQGSRDDE